MEVPKGFKTRVLHTEIQFFQKQPLSVAGHNVFYLQFLGGLQFVKNVPLFWSIVQKHGS